jgi:2-polyprenyl-3-methyl-5-hydroxy-6-metoxy-1,4-benzoquinol methylase
MDRAGCNICRHDGPQLVAEETWVRSNVRAFAGERFCVWRCSRCSSIHARDEVRLDPYYARYPFHHVPADWRARAMYDNQLRRLKRAGLRPHHSILDYGCGSGNFVRHLLRRGYGNAVGFDLYAEQFDDPAVLERTYDCVFAQDVIEHVPSPHGLLDEFENLTAPGSILAIGTPNAAALDLVQPERTIHALHLPYHRHILSKQALVEVGRERGWDLQRYYSTEYANTGIPFLNSSFMDFYMRVADNSIDALFEPPRFMSLLLRLPFTLFWGLCGYFTAPETDVMAIFRKPDHPRELAPRSAEEGRSQPRSSAPMLDVA